MGAVAAAPSTLSQLHGKDGAGEGLCWLLQETTANRLSLREGWKDLRRITAGNLKTAVGSVLPP